MSALTVERLRTLLDYDPVTGIFVRRKTISNALAGSVCGADNGNGYLAVWIDGARYYLHRLAWFYVRGVWPKHEIDHRDMNRKNNSLKNLREATRKQNVENGVARPNSVSGIRGVFWDARRSKWRAEICHNGRNISAGRFETKTEALMARKHLESKFFTHAP